MPDNAAVPLHTAGKPGVSQCKICRLEDRIAVEQFLFFDLVKQ